MPTLHISLPRELIRRDKDRVKFRQYLMDGVDSKSAGWMDGEYFESLRKQAKKHIKQTA